MHIQGEDRFQSIMFPEVLEDYVPQDAQVRYLDGFVDSMDLEALDFHNVQSKATGRPPYHPADLLKLYLYGYLNRVRSSRRLEQETYRNLELIWLIRKLHPDFKTIADFRKINGKAIRQVCRLFTLMCHEEGLFGGEMLAIDGSKFKASNSKKRNFTESKVKRLIKETEKKTEEYLQELDREDAKEAEITRPTKEELRKKIERLNENLKKYRAVQQQMKDAGESQVSLTDPDSRAMYLGQAIQISYNVQFAVDAKNKMIVDHEVTNSVTDLGQLSPLALRAKNLLGVSGFELLADRGYYFGAQVKECQDSGIVPYIPKPNTSVNLKKKMFSKEHFTFVPKDDCYVCPAEKTLTYRFSTTERGRNIRYYIASDCKRCPIKAKCTGNDYRRLTRLEDEAVLDEMATRLRKHPEKYTLRQTLAEHPFGTLKRSMNQDHFLMRGLEKVKTEMSLSVLAYNLKRAFNILGVMKMKAALL